MTHQFSDLMRTRHNTPTALLSCFQSMHHLTATTHQPCNTDQAIATLFPHTCHLPELKLDCSTSSSIAAKPLHVGVLFSGGPAPGGHNVIYGLLEALKKIHPQSSLIGFLGGAEGILKKNFIQLQVLTTYYNSGGFDLLGSGRTKLETKEQLQQALEVLTALELQALVIIGGDDSNTNAALLAEFFLQHQAPIQVIGVPKTIDADLRHRLLDISFGFDTATKLYSELISNLAKDACSARKYTHFVKLMGRSASHITLECALQTHPNLALIGEEILAKKQTLQDVVTTIAQLIHKRYTQGKKYSIILLPEGLIEFIPELKELIQELNYLLAQHSQEKAIDLLSPALKQLLLSLPKTIQEELFLERDPHGNLQLSLISTEQLLIQKVRVALKDVCPFHPLAHFYGYEGRAAVPTVFDSTYCYNLGYVAAALIALGKTSYLCAITHLKEPVHTWQPYAIALTSLIHLEERKGVQKPVIHKTLVDLNSPLWTHFEKNRTAWSLEDHYRIVGPTQFNAIEPPLSLKIQ